MYKNKCRINSNLTSGFEEHGANQSQTPIQSESQSNQSETVISHYYPYSILHINLTLTLSLPYLRLACAVLSLGPIFVCTGAPSNFSQGITGPTRVRISFNVMKTHWGYGTSLFDHSKFFLTTIYQPMLNISTLWPFFAIVNLWYYKARKLCNDSTCIRNIEARICR